MEFNLIYVNILKGITYSFDLSKMVLISLPNIPINFLLVLFLPFKNKLNLSYKVKNEVSYSFLSFSQITKQS